MAAHGATWLPFVLLAAAVMAEEFPGPEVGPPAEQTISFLTDASPDRHPHRLIDILGGTGGEEPHRLRLDISPLLDGMTDFLRRNGVPVERQRDTGQGHTLGVTASFRVREDLPAMTFELSDHSVEPFGAFYGNEGFRAGLVMPVGRFTLRVEGGEDSEFGAYGIAGAQWKHATRPLAVGLGLPIHMRNADGIVGLLLQVRAKIW
jgi:hypothetical protein